MALHVVLRGTALPSSPVDGEELYYVADTTSRVIWHLRYNAGSSSSYKWEMLGEPPLRKHVETAESPTTANTWVDLTTDGPGIAVPLAREYWLAYGVRVTATNVAATFEMTARPWVAGADVGAPNAGHTTVGTTQSNNYASVAARRDIAAYAANDVVKLRYFASRTDAEFRNRWIELHPIRVS